jgi:hypothetical protein
MKVLLILVASIFLVDAVPTSNIRFYVYNQTGQVDYNYGSPTANQSLLATCPRGAKVFLLVPGIDSPVDIFYAASLIKNNLQLFGGCVLFAEYYYYENYYFYLIQNATFNLISSIIAEQLVILNNNGRNISDSGKFCSPKFSINFSLNNSYMSNSIYRAQLWSETDCEYWTDSARK